jgi:hypothetical protein
MLRRSLSRIPKITEMAQDGLNTGKHNSRRSAEEHRRLFAILNTPAKAESNYTPSEKVHEIPHRGSPLKNTHTRTMGSETLKALSQEMKPQDSITPSQLDHWMPSPEGHWMPSPEGHWMPANKLPKPAEKVDQQNKQEAHWMPSPEGHWMPANKLPGNKQGQMHLPEQRNRTISLEKDDWGPSNPNGDWRPGYKD